MDDSRPQRSWAGLGGVTVVTVGLVALVLFPLFELAAQAAAEGWPRVGTALADALSARAAVNTLALGAAATLLAVAGGLAAALVTERAAVPGRRTLRVAMTLPLLIPPFVLAMAWERAYGPSGLVEDASGVTLPGLYGGVGVALVVAVNLVPIAYVVIAATLASRVEPQLERAARVSGAGHLSALRDVTLPLLRPAIAATSALVLVASINAFGVPAILGLPAGFSTVTTQIYRDLNFSVEPAAFTRVVVLSVSLVLVSLVVTAAVDAGGGGRGLVRRTSVTPAAPGSGGRAPVLWWLMWGYALVTSGLPLVALAAMSLTRAVGLSPVPANWTLEHFREAITGSTGEAMVRTLALALSAAGIVMVLGAVLTATQRRRDGRWMGRIATTTFAVPGSALAVAVLLAWGPWLRDTAAIVLIAYLAKFWTIGHRSIDAAAGTVPAGLMDAARVSGARAAEATRDVLVPLLFPAIAAGWTVVFLLSAHELTMSSLLYGPGSATLAVVVLNLQQLGDVGVTSALGVVLILMALAAAVPLTWAGRWWQRMRAEER